MTEAEQVSSLLTTDSTSAGSLLRQARVARGMDIATLAASLKVTEHKLELLESDQWDKLPDMAFARALAQTVCRLLKVDPASVMALLPQARTHRIEQLGEGLNAPFRERSGQEDAPVGAWLRHPAVWGGALVLVATVSLFAMPAEWGPQNWLGGKDRGKTAEVAQQPSSQGGMVTETVPSAVTSAPVADMVEAVPASVPTTTVGGGANFNTPLELRVTTASWVEVQDGRGKILLGRMVQPNEPVLLGGALPLRLKIGNASATEVRFRGQRIDLAQSTRDNVARIDLN